MDINITLEKILDQIMELNKITAVQEQKLREINHRMGDGQHRNQLSHEVLRNDMNKRLDKVDMAIENKVELADYKEAMMQMKDILGKDRRMLITISIILVVGGGAVNNLEGIKKILSYILGVH